MNPPLFDETFLAQLRREYHEARETLFAARRAVERAEIAYQMADDDYVLAATGLRNGMEIVITPEILNVILGNHLTRDADALIADFPPMAVTCVCELYPDGGRGAIFSVPPNSRVGGIPVPLLQEAREQWVNQFGGDRGHA